MSWSSHWGCIPAEQSREVQTGLHVSENWTFISFYVEKNIEMRRHTVAALQKMWLWGRLLGFLSSFRVINRWLLKNDEGWHVCFAYMWVWAAQIPHTDTPMTQVSVKWLKFLRCRPANCTNFESECVTSAAVACAAASKTKRNPNKKKRPICRIWEDFRSVRRFI